MSEPNSRAEKIDRVTPELLNWHVLDDRIKTRSDAYAVVREGRSVLIDPLPLVDEVLEQLGRVEAICLTGSCHQRAAWRYRKRFSVPVHAPEGAEGLEEQPDAWYRKDERPAGGLLAIHAPGPAAAHYALLSERGGGALFCADILYRQNGGIAFVPDQYQDDARRTRDTARSFLELRFTTLCFSHGAPLTENPHGAIRAALEADLQRR